jgi:amino acid adenylation domain-containing protein
VRIHQFIEHTARSVGSRPAVVDGTRALTYSQLDSSANGVSRRLRQEGARRETVVGIALDLSADLVVAVLGVLKTGASVLCLDSAHPREWRQKLLTRARAPILVTDRGSSRDLIGYDGRIVPLEDAAELDNAVAVAHPSGSDDDVAFVCCTSGSTGVPKSVLCTHKGVVNRFGWLASHVGFADDAVGCVRTQPTSAIAAFDLFTPLLAGRTVAVLPSGSARDPLQLLGCISTFRISHLGLVPAMVSVLCESYLDELRSCESLRVIEVGGESSPPGLLQTLADALPQATVLHRYGLTEITAVVCHVVRRSANARRVPIGQPIANTAAHILDEQGQHVVPGISGELYLGGPGLARGYLDDPVETASRFVPDPFGEASGSRLYRTGDLAVMSPQGDMHVLGRRDNQIKWGAHRIEPGEIEAVLMEHPAVLRAVVVLASMPEEAKALVAYAIPRKTSDCAIESASQLPEQLRAHLRSHLPPHLVPHRIVPVQKFPLLPSGKIDRTSLAVLAVGDPSVREPQRASSLREALALEIAHTLGVSWGDEIAKRSFLDLGGDSVQGMRIAAHLRSRYRVEMSLSALFDNTALSTVVDYLYGLCSTVPPTDASVAKR